VVNRVKYCDVCETFKQWLADNGHRFHLKYKIRYYAKRNLISIHFENVTPELHCYVSEGNVGTYVYFKGRCWDFLEEFGYSIRRSRNRKYDCRLCLERKYYNTPQELLIEHSFEKFLEWVNENFTPFHSLELSQCQGMTSARIIDISEPDINAAKREAFRDFLAGLRKIGTDNPPAFTNLDKMKVLFIPVIRSKETKP